MQRVRNRKCIRNLSTKSLRAARLRNTVAILAIILTAVLFTSVFTIVLSISKTYEEENFRQVGGRSHGSFKDLTPEQMDKLLESALIQRSCKRLMLGIPESAPFQKAQVEVSYMDDICAEDMFCVPVEGSLPKEGTNQAATDTRVLKLLGVDPVVGNEFTFTFDMSMGYGKSYPVTETYTLSGFWEYDEASQASHIVLPRDYAEKIMEEYRETAGFTEGRWEMGVFFKNSLNIRNEMDQVLRETGFQGEDKTAENYIGTGVNWGYTGAQLSDMLDPVVLLQLGAAFLLILFTGYLIINNVFRISVTGDIRFYGLLKTIGATDRQIRGMIRRQAMLLSALGIPAGLLAGWLAGACLTPVVMGGHKYNRTVMSANPVIFIGAALFTLITVALSCGRPARFAGRVSPMEAVRYTENSKFRKKEKKSERGSRIWRMALANLARSKSRTILVMISLSLAVFLLNITVAFTNGFDMDKYLGKFVCTDYIIGHSDYFQSRFGSPSHSVPEEMIGEIEQQGGIRESGRIYGLVSQVHEYMTEERLREIYEGRYTPEMLEEVMAYRKAEADSRGMLPESAKLYGMDAYPLSLLEVLEGDLTPMLEGSGDTIVAVVETDDYGNPRQNSNQWQVGDKITLQYVDRFEVIDARTGRPADDSTPTDYIMVKVTESHEKEYTVCARAAVRWSMGYRFFGTEQFVLGSEEFRKATGTDAVMTYLLDMADDRADEAMNIFLKEYTENSQIYYDYEAKQDYADQFYNFRNMFTLMGGILSCVIGFIGVLNYVNTVVTSVISRKREFAVLQAVGMTGGQLAGMLILEGCFYGVGAVILAFILNLFLGPASAGLLAGMFWFFTYRFTFIPILCMIPFFLILGVVIPIAACFSLKKHSLVERIRDGE